MGEHVTTVKMEQVFKEMAAQRKRPEGIASFSSSEYHL
jgi:hypothetical protein